MCRPGVEESEVGLTRAWRYRRLVLRRGTVRAIAFGLAVGTASFAFAASPAIDTPASVVDPAHRVAPSGGRAQTPEDRARSELVDLINAERSRRGLSVLRVEPRVSEAATVHAADMAAHRQMQHTGSDGSDGGVRLDRAGYPWTSWGENIGAGFLDPASLFDAWMNSAGHRANILGDFDDLGIGVVATPDGVPYWAMLVARGG